MTDDQTSVTARPRSAASVERHLAGCPRLDTSSGPPRRPDLRPCTCDPGRLAAAIRPSRAGRRHPLGPAV